MLTPRWAHAAPELWSAAARHSVRSAKTKGTQRLDREKLGRDKQSSGQPQIINTILYVKGQKHLGLVGLMHTSGPEAQGLMK